MDPVTAITAATTAFNLIKKGFAASRDIESMYGDIGRWMGAISDVNQAEKMSKNPHFLKNYLTDLLWSRKQWMHLLPRRKLRLWKMSYAHGLT